MTSTQESTIAYSNPATVDDDNELLNPWVATFREVCDGVIELSALQEDDPSAGRRLTFPRVFEPIELLGSSAHLRRTDRLAEQARRMGFAWASDGRVMTMPAPGAFNRCLKMYGYGDSGFRVAYARDDGAPPSLGPWLLHQMHGVILLQINARTFCESPPEQGEARGQWRWRLISVAHDLSVHALNYHLVPRLAVDDLAERIRQALPARHSTWAKPMAGAPLTLTYFYDNDFNRYAYGVWCRCERPEDFSTIFLAERNYGQLLAALQVRIDETQQGRGDIASGDFNEMGRLTETTFEIR